MKKRPPHDVSEEVLELVAQVNDALLPTLTGESWLYWRSAASLRAKHHVRNALR